MSKTMSGWISEYSAQGMEGDFWRVFQDSAYTGSRTENWAFAGMHQLAAGQHLTLFGAAGEVLWAGELQPHRVGLFGRRTLWPADPDWSPAGVSLETWAGWFRTWPPLAAQLRVK